MAAQKLIALIERHSSELAQGLKRKFLSQEKMSDMHRVPADELDQRAVEIYRNLNDWLLSKTEGQIERRYREIGARRAEQGVSLSHLLWAILAVKQHLWEFLNREAMVDHMVDLLQEVELMQMVDRFFDHAVYYAARGFESARASRAA
jgi:hypothetical protein